MALKYATLAVRSDLAVVLAAVKKVPNTGVPSSSETPPS